MDNTLDPKTLKPSLADARKWAEAVAAGDLLPFSFQYGGQSSAELVPGWKKVSGVGKSKGGVATHELTWRDRKTGFECVIEMQTFTKFPAVEWVMRFRNTGKQDTPLLENIRPLDIEWAPDRNRNWQKDETLLRRSCGSMHKATDFRYQVDPLPAGNTIAMVAGGGRSSNNWLPFFNLQGGKTGVMVGIGWSGQWAAEFARPTDDRIRIRAGQELTKLTLHPGEEIRTPRILLVFWNGEPLAGHNLLRRFLLAHHVPKVEGQPIEAPVCAATWGGMESVHHLQQIQDIRQHRLPYDYYWIDAGWYGPEGSFSPDVYTGEWAKYVGHWNINSRAHPNGLKPLADAAHEAGLKFLLWFEPERALCGTPWTEEHPEWFLGERQPGANLLFNLGDPDARQFLTGFISHFIRDVGIDCYRQDFNFDPLPYWRAADAPDRQGMTEIRYVEGHYQFWDDLLRRHPGLLIDNCSSGGRRIDLETISRSIPLWRSDYQCNPDFDPAGGQTQTHGLSYWIPLHGCGTCGGTHDPRRGDTYNVRSNLSASLEFPIYFNQGDGREDHPWDWQRRMIKEYRRTRPMFYGDYYPLTADTGAPDLFRRNLLALEQGGVRLDGVYLDVFAVVAPEECYHPDHPMTRRQCLEYRAECFDLARTRAGVISSEEPSDWAVPYIDWVDHVHIAEADGQPAGIPIPLFSLVYHDAMLVPWHDRLQGALNAGLPWMSLTPDDAELERAQALCDLHRRVGRLEMTRHEFLDASYRRQRTTFANSTTVTVDFATSNLEISPGGGDHAP